MARDMGREASAATGDQAAKPGVSCSAVKAVGARIADACNDEGEGLRPLAKEFLADDTGLSEKLVQRALGQLRELGILAASAGGTGGRGIAPRYQIDIDRLSDFVPDEKLPRRMRSRVVVEPSAAAVEKGDVMTPFSDGDHAHSEPESGSSVSPFVADERGTSESKRGTLETVKGVTGAPHNNNNKNSNHAGAPARSPEGARPTRARKRRKSQPEPGDMPKPPKLTPPDGREGEIIAAALAGNDPNIAFKIKPWVGRFRLAECLGEGGGLRFVLMGTEHEFRSVFTGALKHLGYPTGQDARIFWMPTFAAKALSKGKARWAASGAPDEWFERELRPQVTELM
jgi:hypothetical protein